jgi:hypothetical protein
VGCCCGVLARVRAGHRVPNHAVELGHDGSLSLCSKRGPESQGNVGGRCRLWMLRRRPGTYWLARGWFRGWFGRWLPAPQSASAPGWSIGWLPQLDRDHCSAKFLRDSSTLVVCRRLHEAS